MNIGKIAKDPVIIEKDIGLKEAADLLVSKKAESFLFVRKDSVQGVVTRTDLLKNFGKEGNVSEIMDKNFKKISFEESLDRARHMLEDPDCNMLIVEKKGKLLGIVSMRDMVSEEEDGDFIFE